MTYADDISVLAKAEKSDVNKLTANAITELDNKGLLGRYGGEGDFEYPITIFNVDTGGPNAEILYTNMEWNSAEVNGYDYVIDDGYFIIIPDHGGFSNHEDYFATDVILNDDYLSINVHYLFYSGGTQIGYYGEIQWHSDGTVTVERAK